VVVVEATPFPLLSPTPTTLAATTSPTQTFTRGRVEFDAAQAQVLYFLKL
jgi:hypothetical protein